MLIRPPSIQSNTLQQDSNTNCANAIIYITNCTRIYYDLKKHREAENSSKNDVISFLDYVPPK